MTTEAEKEIRARYEAFMTKVEELARDMAITEMVCFVAYEDESGYMHPATVCADTPVSKYIARAIKSVVQATAAAAEASERMEPPADPSAN